MSAMDLRSGRWQEALADVGEVDAVITDPPYGARTHEGHREGTFLGKGVIMRNAIPYDPWSPCDVRAFVAAWAPRVRGWVVVFSCHALAPVYHAALVRAGRYVFAPLPFVDYGGRVRLMGDGPSSWATWITVARPKTREFQRWATLPGAYVSRGGCPPGGGTTPYGADVKTTVVGGKPLWLMRALVRDYSRRGDLVCDPCAGGGTTLLAAAIEGRRAVGAEQDPITFQRARERLEVGYTPSLFPGDTLGDSRREHEQGHLPLDPR